MAVRTLNWTKLCLGALALTAALAGGAARANDLDKDGIDDGLEHQLLQRYRPYFAFAGNETFRPQDVLFYLENSEVLRKGDEGTSPLVNNATLRAMPAAVLGATREGDDYCSETAPGAGAPHTCVSDLFSNRRQTNFRINPLAHPQGATSDNPGRHGQEWAAEMQRKNIGLYGHVVPIHLDSLTWPCDQRWDTVGHDPASPLYIKVEYWQFFGYNSQDKPGNIGDHEGDWTSVQMLLAAVQDPVTKMIRPKAPEAIVAVMMYAHGKEFRFNIQPGDKVSLLGQVQERRGRNYGKSVDINLNGKQCDSAVINAQDNLVRLYAEAGATQYIHPVVFVERGGHESWPSEAWSYYGAQKHDGTGPNFLTETPPNLGEVDNPMHDYAGAVEILHFNGLWGAYGSDNTPPPGPALHGEWGWPGDSSIEWLLKKGRPY